jgi:hypothetical protein
MGAAWWTHSTMFRGFVNEVGLTDGRLVADGGLQRQRSQDSGSIVEGSQVPAHGLGAEVTVWQLQSTELAQT